MAMSMAMAMGATLKPTPKGDGSPQIPAAAPFS